MLTRRGLLAAATVGALAACGRGGSVDGASGPGAFARDALATDPAGRTVLHPELVTSAAASVTTFTADLYGRLARPATGNLVCSPYSVAQALAMTAQGARGTTAAQLCRVLHTDGDVSALGAGLGSLDLALAQRAGRRTDGHGLGRDVELTGANAVWGQRGISWEEPFLAALARSFGTGVRQVDFATALEAARSAINLWVSGRTRTRIPALLAPGVLTAKTALVLVNALYLKAPWHSPFEKENTRQARFTRLDGSVVTANLMSTTVGDAGHARGDGWEAVTLPYAGKELAMTVVLPDHGRFAAVETALDGAALARILRAPTPTPLMVTLPRWTSRTQASLAAQLAALGMDQAFDPRADFSGITRAERLSISFVVHEGFIAVDEQGTEAAAATAVGMDVAAAQIPPLSVTVDRPFLYVVHDVETRTPLFVGRVADPTVG